MSQKLSWKLIFPRFFWIQAEQILVYSYWQLVCHLFYGQEQCLIFSKCLKRCCVKTVLVNYRQKLDNWLITYFYHTNRNIIITMSFTDMQCSYYFQYILIIKLKGRKFSYWCIWQWMIITFTSGSFLHSYMFGDCHMFTKLLCTFTLHRNSYSYLKVSS